MAARMSGQRLITVCELSWWRPPRSGHSAVVTEPFSDPWRDVDGTHISLLSRVEQATVDKNHGALQERLHHQGQVIGRGTNLIYVRFDYRNQLIALRPQHVRVLGQQAVPRQPKDG